jgi:hypothetical protein
VNQSPWLPSYPTPSASLTTTTTSIR